MKPGILVIPGSFVYVLSDDFLSHRRRKAHIFYGLGREFCNLFFKVRPLMQSSQTIHLYLKENTKPLHDQTEFVMKSREMMDMSYTVEEYIRFLQIQLRFHQVLETVLLAHPRISGHEQLDWPRRRRSHLAMQDLETLEANPTLDSIIHFPNLCFTFVREMDNRI
ncbi:MAG: biliverdin-producing heme oxygenase [Bacteroidota bacterium]